MGNSATFDYTMMLEADGTLVFGTGPANSSSACDYLSSTDAIEFDRWTHVAFEIDQDAGTKTIWVDGEVFETCSGLQNKNPIATGALAIGMNKWNGGSNLPFVGVIDEVRVSDTLRYTTSFTPEVYVENDADNYIRLQ